MRRHPRNWYEMQRILEGRDERDRLQEIKVIGRGPRQNINDRIQPFSDRQDGYVSIYRGYLFCPEDGEYRFATDSDDASFVLLDGKLILQWPGGHAPAENWSHSVTVPLSRGMHPLEYYHEEIEGGQLAQLAWARPGEKELSIIPGDAFPTTLHAVAVERARQNSRLDAFFSYRCGNAVSWNGRHLETPVHFTDASRSEAAGTLRYSWNFGDGSTSRERNPVHGYAGSGDFPVTLSVEDNRGNRDTYTAVIRVAPEREAPLLLESELTEISPVARREESKQVCLQVRSSSLSDGALSVRTALRDREGNLSSVRNISLAEPVESTSRWFSFGENVLEGDWTCRVLYRDTPLVTHTVRLRSAQRPGPLRCSGDRLEDSEGIPVILQTERGSRIAWELKTKPVLEIGLVDDFLFGPGTYEKELPFSQILRERFEKEGGRVGIRTLSGGPDDDLLSLISRASSLSGPAGDLVILSCGSRDIECDRDVTEFRKRLEALAFVLASRGSVPVLVNPRDIPLVRNYALAVKELALEKGIPVADCYSAFLLSGKEPASLYRDGEDGLVRFFPGEEGQRIIAETLFRTILSDLLTGRGDRNGP